MSKSIVPLLRAGVAAYSFYTAARSNIKQASVMPSYGVRRRRVTPRRKIRTMFNPRRTGMPRAGDNTMLRYTRVGTPLGVPLVAGTAGFVQDISLGQIYTADLSSIYQYYRIMDVTAIITPRVDPGNSGINPNAQVHCYVANDVAAEFTSVTSANIPTQFSNQKYQALVAGKSMYYKFWPKVTSTIDNNGTAVNVGAPGKINDWIKFNGPGGGIPHHRLIFWAQTSLTSTQSIDIVFKITFDVKGLA